MGKCVNDLFFEDCGRCNLVTMPVLLMRGAWWLERRAVSLVHRVFHVRKLRP